MRSRFEPPAEFDDYVIVRELGQGAMGQVYLAEDAVLARPIAIKFTGADPDPAARQRFLMEARAIARIQHPNVVAIYRVGELGDQPYIVSELVRGSSLAAVERPLPWARVLPIAIDLSRGLAAAHRNGVVHCDIKPANIMLTEDGVAKLVDFGLARIQGSDEQAGAGVGTPDYMAPEVWDGSAPTRRSDVYSLGAVIYELVAGSPPFGAVPPADLARTVREQDAPALTAEPRVAALVARCLARDPAERFASGEELREALEQIDASRHQAARLDHNPYRGLRAFEAEHRGVFFGRGLEVGELVDRLRTQSVVVVAGDSGVGKSSLCRAGVVPAIVDGGLGDGRSWRAITVIPGRRPLTALAAALGAPGLEAKIGEDPGLLARELHHRAGTGGLVLFIDQMEELVTVGDPAEVAAFDAALARLSEGAAGVRVITTARADFLSKLISMPAFGRELSHVLYFVQPLPPERIRDVIVGPAAATEVTFESDAMIDELVAATTEAGSGGLPLLSFALAALWEARDRERGVITRAVLDSMGGVAGALARHADSVVGEMQLAERAHARRVLLRLVTSVGTRVRRTEAELSVSEGSKTALAALVKGRLLVVHDGDGGPVYEIAHEVLVRGWGTLREWLDTDSKDRASRERLAEATLEWQRIGRRSDATYRGPRLVEALALDSTNLTPAEREFIAGSVRASRMRKWMLRGSVIAAIAIAGGAFGIQRYLAARRLAGEVDRELASAGGDLEVARTADADQKKLATSAFERFDHLDNAGGEALWDRTAERRAAAARAYRAAARKAEAALAKDPTRTDAREMIGDILVARAELAEVAHDNELRDESLDRVEAYDPDGSRRAFLNAPGTLEIHAAGNVSVDGRAAGSDRIELSLPAGLHVVDVTAPDRAPIHEPVLIAHRGRTSLSLTAPAPVPAGMIYIADGVSLYGSAADDETRRNFLSNVPLHSRHTAAFLIARHEVTLGDWLAYVDAQPQAQRSALVPNIPLSGAAGGITLMPTPAGWRLTLQPIGQKYSADWGQPLHYQGRDRRVDQDWRNFPALGITADEAEAYTAWLDRSGALPHARLCTELEWNRAARGADGRDTPMGTALGLDDANVDITYGRDHMGPDEVGSHPVSNSPYGAADMAGNAFEWTRGERTGTYVILGGSYFHDRKTAGLANRNEASRSLRDASAGMRVCASLTR
ncbi:MAG: bifunctional serine/threonine-protein kinase/formylglycine-generating enzyme family protein [Deltaproteobacteria bacterium]